MIRTLTRHPGRLGVAEIRGDTGQMPVRALIVGPLFIHRCGVRGLLLDVPHGRAEIVDDMATVWRITHEPTGYALVDADHLRDAYKMACILIDEVPGQEWATAGRIRETREPHTPGSYPRLIALLTEFMERGACERAYGQPIMRPALWKEAAHATP